MEWAAWIPTVITAGLATAFFIAKHRIKAGIERSVQHKFNEKIETLRGEIRKSEEEFKSELRLKETEFSALRGRSSRSFGGMVVSFGKPKAACLTFPMPDITGEKSSSRSVRQSSTSKRSAR